MICERCGKATKSVRMSFFNTEMLCKDCQDEESKHPSYKKAKEVERSEYLKGNRNFEGVGLPKDLREKYQD